MSYSSIKGKMPLLVFFIALISSLSACNDEPHYDYVDETYRTGLVGVWDYAYNERGPITNPHYIDSFSFSPDGSGYYAYEDDFGDWVNVPFSWCSYNYNFLEIYYYSGEVVSTYYYFDRGYLVFGDAYTYSGYAPLGVFPAEKK